MGRAPVYSCKLPTGHLYYWSADRTDKCKYRTETIWIAKMKINHIHKMKEIDLHCVKPDTESVRIVVLSAALFANTAGRKSQLVSVVLIFDKYIRADILSPLLVRPLSSNHPNGMACGGARTGLYNWSRVFYSKSTRRVIGTAYGNESIRWQPYSSQYYWEKQQHRRSKVADRHLGA